MHLRGPFLIGDDDPYGFDNKSDISAPNIMMKNIQTKKNSGVHSSLKLERGRI